MYQGNTALFNSCEYQRLRRDIGGCSAKKWDRQRKQGETFVHPVCGQLHQRCRLQILQLFPTAPLWFPVVRCSHGSSRPNPAPANTSRRLWGATYSFPYGVYGLRRYSGKCCRVLPSYSIFLFCVCFLVCS